MFPCLSLPVDSGPVPMDAEICALGLMSGTSLDGVDAAVLTTDGVSALHPGPALTFPYPESFKEELRALLGLDPSIEGAQAVEDGLTRIHAHAVEQLLLQVKNGSPSEPRSSTLSDRVTRAHNHPRPGTWLDMAIG